MTREMSSQMGLNKTGIGLSPIDSQAMIDAAKSSGVVADGHQFDEWHVRFAEEAMPYAIGSVPPPATIKGAAKAAGEILMGTRPNVLVDKLGSRLAFERTGSRLYESMLAKFASTGSDGAMKAALEQFRDQEIKHFQIVRAAMEKMGVDSTAQTPAADVAGVQSSGLLQVISDPRTSVLHCLDSLLIAELADRDSWLMLRRLAESLGHSDLLGGFDRAIAEERVHLDTVRRWCQERVEREAHRQD